VQAVPLPLLDPMRRDLVQQERPEDRIQARECQSVARPTVALVEGRMVGEVRLRELPEGDVRLPADAVASLEDARALLGFDVLGLAPVRGLRATRYRRRPMRK
jgi:hypothetical protein